jgi:hypothetical protein
MLPEVAEQMRWFASWHPAVRREQVCSELK